MSPNLAEPRNYPGKRTSVSLWSAHPDGSVDFLNQPWSIEAMPLEKAPKAYAKMMAGKASFRMVPITKDSAE